MKKRLISLVLALLLALNIVPSVFAADDPLDLAKKKILEGYATGTATVDLSNYNLTKARLEKLYDELYYSNELPWYASNYQYSYTESTGIVQSFTPQFLDETQYDRALYEQKVAEILAETVLPGMTQLEIALSVHDYLAANFVYDETKTYYEGYDLLVRGTAVCNGYAEAYMELLKRSGVECHYVISEIMDHGWNQVKLGDHWYHVDVTWDDPIPNRQGNVEHTYFMLSDEKIGSLEKPHYAYEALHKSTDITYDGEDFWDGVSGQISYESADVYYYHKYADKTNFICRSEDGKESVLYQFDGGIIDGNTIYRYKTKGLSLVGDRLYFCSGSTVYSIDTTGGDIREEYAEEASASHGILGCQLTGNTLGITTWDLKETYEDKSVKLENVTVHTHTYEQDQVAGVCNQRGGTRYTCACGVSYTVEDVDAPGHDYEIENRQARGLFENGWETWTCTQCGDSYTETKYAFLSEEFLSDWNNLRWILLGAVALLVIIGKGKKKK